jgi:hypothetical protein
VLLQAAGLRPSGPASRAVPVIEAAESSTVEGWDVVPALAMAAEVGDCVGGGTPPLHRSTALPLYRSASCGRLAVVSGSTLLFPPFARSGETANLAVALDLVAWLVDRPAALTLPPAAVERVRLFLEPSSLRLLWWWLVVAMPIGAALAGFVVLRARQRAGG